MTAYFVHVVITYQLAEGSLTLSLYVHNNNNNNNNNIHVFASAE